MTDRSVGLGFEPTVAPRSQPVTLRVWASDIEQAKALAARKGIGYQTLMKMLIHEGLERESRKP